MAVEYIRSLERLLGFDFPPLGGANSSSSGDDSFMFIKDEFDCLDEQFDDSLSNYELEEQQQQQPQSQQQPQPQELLPSVTSLNGLQYVRIPGTSTYQLLTPDILDANSSSLDEEQFNALIDTNCLSNSSTAAAAAAATATACVNLSRSPVPTSPSPISPTTTTSTVSPVAIAVANELLLQACAAQQQQQQQQQQQLIKQEYSEGDFVPNNNNSRSPNSSHNYAQPQPQQQQQQSTAEEQLLCSPVLPAFYDQEPQQSFYDNVVVGLPSFKKEFTDVLHDQSNNNTAGCLSDESMIDAIDWWEAHTPKSDAPGL
ncbi:ase [Drosophila busckii]|uniref:Ase n=2 Tax=Drosophila busckii TaxID=30019 RepID=A0A0M3QZ25_DROBS|nr:ase [Drosophila busckii]